MDFDLAWAGVVAIKTTAKHARSRFIKLGLLFQGIADLGEQFFGFRRCDLSSLASFESIDRLHKCEDTGTDNHELDDSVDETTVGKDGGTVFLGIRKCGVVLSVEGKVEVLEVNALQDQSYWRHHDVTDQGGDDFAKGGSHNDTDRQIDDIPATDEFFKLSEKSCGALDDFFWFLDHGRTNKLKSRNIKVRKRRGG